MLELFQQYKPKSWEELFFMAATIIVLAVAAQLGQCIANTLKRIETKIERNTRETIRAARAAERNSLPASQEGEH